MGSVRGLGISTPPSGLGTHKVRSRVTGSFFLKDGHLIQVYIYVGTTDVGQGGIFVVDYRVSSFTCRVTFGRLHSSIPISSFRFSGTGRKRCQHEGSTLHPLLPFHFLFVMTSLFFLFLFKTGILLLIFLMFTVVGVYSSLVPFLEPCYFLCLHHCDGFLV